MVLVGMLEVEASHSDDDNIVLIKGKVAILHVAACRVYPDH